MNKPLPIGIEDYKELIENNYYYVDKTGLVKELLDNRSKVTLFMRPRRLYLDALAFLSRVLKEVYGKNAILLLDEYDVPLENACFNGFYKQMTDFIRSLFESALRTNPHLEFAVVTGCLRITKESIFTGLNNLKMVSVLDISYSEYFGFTQPEVDLLLQHYNISGRQDEVKSWYNGYLFGKTEVYNPWSILMYADNLRQDSSSMPKPYWANTSSNSIVRELVEHSDNSVKQEMEALIEGGTIEKPVHEDIAYEDIYKSTDNLWNFLFFTGYLKKVKTRLEDVTTFVTLAIPNQEVKYIYQNTILDWFGAKLRQKNLTGFYKALLQKDTLQLERELSKNLMETISFYDYGEDYYHGFLGGLLKMMEGYTIKSNRENGMGRSDLLLLSAPYDGLAIIIEIKVADTFAQLDEKAEAALKQIEEKQYDAELKLEGYHTFIKYGVSFYKKLCRINSNKYDKIEITNIDIIFRR